ncbi:hypothetical protein GCM10025880_19390 [Methylorubrum aminovorans]|nr:hypothetical protein GCM10025880_19390 [Methylorubrum aminovorans]
MAVIERARRVEEEDGTGLGDRLVHVQEIGAGAGHHVPLLRPVGLEQHLRLAVRDVEQGVAGEPDVAGLAQERGRPRRARGGERGALLRAESGAAAVEARRLGIVRGKAGKDLADHLGLPAHPPPQPVEQGGLAGKAPVAVEARGVAGEDKTILDPPRMRRGLVRSGLLQSCLVQFRSSRIVTRSRHSQYGESIVPKGGRRLSENDDA